MILTIEGRRPTTVNKSRTMHYRARAADDKWWREMAFANLAGSGLGPRRQPVPTPVIVTATPLLVERNRWLQDPGACYPSVKAALDGVVDAKVIPGDTGEFVAEIRMRPPRFGEVDGLELLIEEAP